MQLYVHIPFCKSKCRYCDFVSFADCDDTCVLGYLTALKHEIALSAKYYGKTNVTSIYIGGGTPSILPDGCLADLLNHIKSLYHVSLSAEITVECNPESIMAVKLEEYLLAGVNRISLGIQSLNDCCLLAIGRAHDSGRALSALKLIHNYFNNISADLIVGLPNNDEIRVEREIEIIAPYVKHVSVYMLQLEEGTPLCNDVKAGKICVPDGDQAVTLFDKAVDKLRTLGFERYEISNFAKVGFESRHNNGYWLGEEYLGFGVNASSYVKTCDGVSPLTAPIRRKNVCTVEEYLKHSQTDDYPFPSSEYEELTVEDEKEEKIMLGLRLKRGIPKELIADKMGLITEKFPDYFEISQDKVALNDKGMDVMNYIVSELI